MTFNVYQRSGKEGRFRWIGKVSFERFGALPFKRPPHIVEPGRYAKTSQPVKIVPVYGATDPNTSMNAALNSAGPGNSRPAAVARSSARSSANSR